MISDPQEFFGSAKEISLTQEEKNQSWSAIAAAMQAGQSGCEPDVVRFFQAAAHESLSAEEKHDALREMRSMLSCADPASDEVIAAFFAPAQETCMTVQEKESAHAAALQVRSWGFLRLLPSLGWGVPALSIVLVVLAGAGMSYAAGDSLPGDFLYPIKKVQENIQTDLPFGTQSHAETRTAQVGIRLKEAESLRAKNRLSKQVGESVDQEFRLERRSALDNIQQLISEGKEEQASSLHARLNAYQDAYDRLMNGHLRGDPEPEVNATEHVSVTDAASSSYMSASASHSNSSRAASSSVSVSLPPVSVHADLGASVGAHASFSLEADTHSSSAWPSSNSKSSGNEESSRSSSKGLPPEVDLPL